MTCGNTQAILLWKYNNDCSISNGLMPDQRAKFNTHAADIMITEESNTSDMLDVDRYNLFTEP